MIVCRERRGRQRTCPGRPVRAAPPAAPAALGAGGAQRAQAAASGMRWVSSRLGSPREPTLISVLSGPSSSLSPHSPFAQHQQLLCCSFWIIPNYFLAVAPVTPSPCSHWGNWRPAPFQQSAPARVQDLDPLDTAVTGGLCKGPRELSDSLK